VKQIYSARDLLDAQLLNDFISDHKIEVLIKGGLLIGAIGEIPADTTPSIWVLDDDDYDRAKELVAVFEARDNIVPAEMGVWKCLDCDELIEPQFSQCWHCGKSRAEARESE